MPGSPLPGSPLPGGLAHRRKTAGRDPSGEGTRPAVQHPPALICQSLRAEWGMPLRGGVAIAVGFPW